MGDVQVAVDGAVVFAIAGRTLHRYSEDGTLVWHRDTAQGRRPVADADAGGVRWCRPQRTAGGIVLDDGGDLYSGTRTTVRKQTVKRGGGTVWTTTLPEDYSQRVRAATSADVLLVAAVPARSHAPVEYRARLHAFDTRTSKELARVELPSEGVEELSGGVIVAGGTRCSSTTPGSSTPSGWVDGG